MHGVPAEPAGPHSFTRTRRRARAGVRQLAHLIQRIYLWGAARQATARNERRAMENRATHMPSAGVGVWEHFTMADGLPDMKIECVFEDSRGILWIGTHDRGVVRYEGDEFVAYNRRDGLAGDACSALWRTVRGTCGWAPIWA